MNKQAIKFLEQLCTNKNRIDKVPKNYFTIEQVSKFLKISVSNARRRIRYVIENEPSKIECKDFFVEAGSRILKVRHYKFNKK